ncbi:MAG: peptidylprolyl isomerase [Bacteroidia bacterium]|nr:peptidylprolyl isomerase [Bacteroidia bacterium]
MKKHLISIICLATAMILAASCGNSEKKAAAEAAAAAEAEAAEQAAMLEKQKEAMVTVATLPDEPVFDIVTNLGTMRIKLYSQTPKHRENFAKLAISGYYDGLLFHRVINGFMIQGGDPLTKNPDNAAKYGTGGPDYTIPAEFIPEYTHKKGALAAARRGDAANPMKESSGSQFYIVQDEAACAQLNGDYTVFGETISGLDVIDKIASVETGARDLPVQDVRIQTIKLVNE